MDYGKNINIKVFVQLTVASTKNNQTFLIAKKNTTRHDTCDTTQKTTG